MGCHPMMVNQRGRNTGKETDEKLNLEKTGVRDKIEENVTSVSDQSDKIEESKKEDSELTNSLGNLE